jgi:hypothetical protein
MVFKLKNSMFLLGNVNVLKLLKNKPLYCNENPIYVFPEKELRGLSLNFYIHVSVSDLYNPWISPHIFLQHNRQTDGENI